MSMMHILSIYVPHDSESWEEGGILCTLLGIPPPPKGGEGIEEWAGVYWSTSPPPSKQAYH